ncbi:EAL domain-containing protein [Roseibium sp. RKSG952]|uniref:EAL domain-containing protein n=1 Tax=Roseibium sp. RKSG952 TaxID=2529384 RepID=UPI0012BC5185|nr:EAL domain-containing protein [Roseibium sp. RKSG952]MTI00624.1 EAL domain-containing protein [Roseibium sp. RKSG952]
MGRLAAIFVLFFVGGIAFASAALLMFHFGRPFGEAVALGLALMCTMIVIHFAVARAQERKAVAEAFARLEDRMSDFDEDLDTVESRVTGVEQTVPDRTRAEMDPLFAEVELLGSLVKQMAEAMSDLEIRVEEQAALPPPPQQFALPRQEPQALFAGTTAGKGALPRKTQAGPADNDGVPPARNGARKPGRNPSRADGKTGAATDPAMRELIQGALDANRVELYLQPIVSLPQRQVRYYEAFTKLRDAEGTLLNAAVFTPEAIRSGMMPRIDNLLLIRSLQVLKRLSSRNRTTALFCNISAQSLANEALFPGFLEFVRSNRSYSETLVFEFSQSDVAAMGIVEMESLNALYELGFRFSIDRVDNLKMDFKALAQRGFKYAKLHADYLIGRRNANHGHIHPADFGDLLNRYGVDLITDHVETESQALELLDYEVRLAQGYLFAQPRPVRAEVLQGTPAPVSREKAAGAG